jgi:hypothetical protein
MGPPLLQFPGSLYQTSWKKKLALFFQDKLELPWLKIALEFASLDVYPPFLYDKIFDSHFLDKYVREDNVLDYFQLVSVHQVS